MTYPYPFLAASSAVALALAAGCSSAVIGGNSGGAGGAGPSTSSSTSTSTSTSSTSTSTSTSSTSTSTSASSGSTSGGEPPGPPGANPPDGSAFWGFAISKLFLGDTDRNGLQDPTNGWKQYGYDLDHTVSTQASTNLCKPRLNAAPKNVYPDGNVGIDNSFGKNILPILLGLAADFPGKVNQAIAAGKGTTLFFLSNLGAGSDYYPVPASAYRGGDLGQPPPWGTAFSWPYTSDSVTSAGNPGTALAQTSAAWVVGNTMVAPYQGDLTMKLESGGFPMELPIHNPLVTLELTPGHDGGTNGTIAGVIPTDLFLAKIKQLAGAFDPSLCSGPTLDSVLAQISQASDILVDGTQDPTKECDGISVGLGFDAQHVSLSQVQMVSPPPNPCP